MQIKAVFHIDETEKWKLVIGNIKNLIKALTDTPFEIEIVANSVAVFEYKKEAVFSQLNSKNYQVMEFDCVPVGTR